MKVVAQALAKAAAGPEGAADVDHLFFTVVNYIDAVLGGRSKRLARRREAVPGR